jgi:hypothetical protein
MNLKSITSLFTGLFILIFTISCARKIITILDRPIVFDEKRSQLSLDYMNEHYGMITEAPVIEPKMVVLHWTAIPTFAGSFEAFYPALLPASREKIATASTLNVSVPYLIDRDGSIYQLMPDTLFARHVIGLNYCAIGVENVGDGDEYPLTNAQLEANIQLIHYLAAKYDIDYVIGHHEYKKFIGHPLWKEKDPGYLTDKTDPGDAFMEKVRSLLKDLDLKPLPETVGSQQRQ